MFRFSAFILLCLVGRLAAAEFTLLVYNVENLFDADGVAVYEDYGDNTLNPNHPYTPAKLLTKLENISRILEEVDGGRGPDVILFQEFELDRTPFDSTGDPAALLAPWGSMPLTEMLGESFDAAVGNLPVEALLWKLLEEQGRGGYFVAKPDPLKSESHSAHCNVVFSRFPISWVRQRPLEQARDVLIAGLDIDGHEFILMNNHWKSGASSQNTAAIRRQNAHVVRSALEAELLRNTSADLVIAGDLNCHYNHAAVFPSWGELGINHVLGSQTNEVALVEGKGPTLYNLWGELPLEQRGSEVYRGHWGTLMQILVTRGLYDQAGVQYIDNSFFRLAIPGVNIEPLWGQPIRWAADGNGAGFSDHLPVGARFRTVEAADPKSFVSLRNGTAEATLPTHRPTVDYANLPAGRYPRASILNSLSAGDRGKALGRVFDVEGRVARDGRRLEIDGKFFGVYMPDRSLRARWKTLKPGERVQFYGEYGVFRGEPQFVVQDPGWWRQ